MIKCKITPYAVKRYYSPHSGNWYGEIRYNVKVKTGNKFIINFKPYITVNYFSSYSEALKYLDKKLEGYTDGKAFKI